MLVGVGLLSRHPADHHCRLKAVGYIDSFPFLSISFRKSPYFFCSLFSSLSLHFLLIQFFFTFKSPISYSYLSDIYSSLLSVLYNYFTKLILQFLSFSHFLDSLWLTFAFLSHQNRMISLFYIFYYGWVL